MTKKKVQERKKVALKPTNKAKGSSSRAQPKKTQNNRKRLASDDDDSSSNEAPEKPAHSRKKAKKVVEEEVQLEEEDEDEEVVDIGKGIDTEDEADHDKVSDGPHSHNIYHLPCHRKQATLKTCIVQIFQRWK